MAVLHKFRYTTSSNFGAPAANSLNISSDSERKKYNIKKHTRHYNDVSRKQDMNPNMLTPCEVIDRSDSE